MVPRIWAAPLVTKILDDGWRLRVRALLRVARLAPLHFNTVFGLMHSIGPGPSCSLDYAGSLDGSHPSCGHCCVEPVL